MLIFSDIEFEIYNLGSMVWMEKSIKSWVIGHLRNNILAVEQSIEDALNSTTNLQSLTAALVTLFS